MSRYTWTRIPAAPLPRSSHSLSVVGGKAYIFGGEIIPRQPVDNAMHIINISSGEYEKIESHQAPTARVGHTAGVVDGEICIFGGRGGKEMTPLEESGTLHIFSPTSKSWRSISPESKDAPYPSARSYHASTSASSNTNQTEAEKIFYVHAGCPAAGRLSDLWSFNFDSKRWTQLANAPGDGRGGTAMCWDESRRRIWRFGGYNGKTELGGGIDYVPLSNGTDATQNQAEWSIIPFPSTSSNNAGGPEPRSVAALHPLGTKLLTLFGEGKPSPTGGHDAAGNFWGDVWAFNPETTTWEEVKIDGEKPEERGWFASDVCDVDGEGGGGVVVWGGIDSGNERLGDGWVLSVA